MYKITRKIRVNRNHEEYTIKKIKTQKGIELNNPRTTTSKIQPSRKVALEGVNITHA